LYASRGRSIPTAAATSTTGTGGWRCPRYSFSNRSEDILEIFRWTCDLLDLRWTVAPHTVYVSRMADVARVDEFIGPKS
jgi:hypothetical protein